jgi:hypothetical protein
MTHRQHFGCVLLQAGFLRDKHGDRIEPLIIYDIYRDGSTISIYPVGVSRKKAKTKQPTKK